MADSSSSAWRIVRHKVFTPGVMITAMACLALNVIVVRHDTRLDMTDEGIYTLSEVSERVLEDASAPIHVDVFWSADMPPPLHTTRQSMEDMLDEYAASGRLTYTMTAPARGDDAPRERGCREVALSQRTADSVSVRAVYRCLVLSSGDRTHVVADVPLTGRAEVDNLELEITRGLLALTRTRARKLGIVRGLGGPADVPDFVETARGVFDELYDGAIEPVGLDLSVDRPHIPADIDAVVILNVARPIPERARFELDQHLVAGGALGWFQSSSVPDEKLIAQLSETLGPADRVPSIYRPVDTGLTEQVASYGVRHRQDLVLDAERAMSGVVWTPMGVTPARNPAVFRADGLARELSFRRYTSVLVLPAPASLEVTSRARDNPDIEVTVAATSGPEATRLAEPLRTRTYEAVMAADDGVERGAFPLIVAIEGRFQSYYDERALPAGVQEDARRGESSTARLLVIGSGDFILPQPAFGYDQQLAEHGQQLFFQSLEWLLQDDALAQVRDRRVPEFLGDVPASTRWRVQLINIVFVPASFLLLGYGMFLRRRRRQSMWRGDRS